MQAVLEFFAVGLTQLKHCLRFVSRLACGTKELKCKTVNPTKKMIDPKKIQFGGKSENYSGLFNYRINVSSGKGLSKSQTKALQGQQTMYIEMKEGYELVKVESFVSAMAGGTGRNALTKSKQGNGYQIRLSATMEDGKTYLGAYSRIIITCKKEGKGYSKREFEIYP